MSLRSDFRDFITKSNLIQLATAFVFGVAFTAVVMALVTDIISPLIGIPGHANLDQLGQVNINGSIFYFGSFATAVINFLIIALVLFFILVRPYMHYQARQDAKKATTMRDCPDCLSSVPIKATRCSFCTSMLPPVAPQAAAAKA